jgi:hypothetical protein
MDSSRLVRAWRCRCGGSRSRSPIAPGTPQVLVGGYLAQREHPDPPTYILLDTDNTDDPTYGEQEWSAYHGYYGQHIAACGPHAARYLTLLPQLDQPATSEPHTLVCSHMWPIYSLG